MATETSRDLNSRPGIGDRGSGIGPLTHPVPDPRSPIPAQPTAWERVQIARHPDRPHTLDYIQRLCTDFVELHGDRLYGDDAAIIGGLAGFDVGLGPRRTVMLIGHQKGRSTKENIARSFGMPQPEGYRKAQRLMEHAAGF